MKATSRRTAPLLAIGLAVSAVCLWYFLRGVDIAQLGTALAAANYVYLAPALVCYALMYIVRAWRWAYLLPSSPEDTFRRRLNATVIGFMGNSIFPARAGEVLRPAAYGLMTGVPVGAALASIVVERVFDLAFVLSALGAVLMWLPVGSSATMARARVGGGILGVAMLGVVLVIVALEIWPAACRSLLVRLTRVLPGTLGERVSAFAMSVVDGLLVLRSMKDLLAVIALTVLHWGLQLACFWVLGLSFGLSMGLLGATLVFVFTALAVAVPQGPGFIGVFQLAVKAALDIVGAATYPAAAFAIVVWLLCIVPITLAGFVALSVEGLSLKRVRAGNA